MQCYQLTNVLFYIDKDIDRDIPVIYCSFSTRSAALSFAVVISSTNTRIDLPRIYMLHDRRHSGITLSPFPRHGASPRNHTVNQVNAIISYLHVIVGKISAYKGEV